METWLFDFLTQFVVPVIAVFLVIVFKIRNLIRMIWRLIAGPPSTPVPQVYGSPQRIAARARWLKLIRMAAYGLMIGVTLVGLGLIVGAQNLWGDGVVRQWDRYIPLFGCLMVATMILVRRIERAEAKLVVPSPNETDPTPHPTSKGSRVIEVERSFGRASAEDPDSGVVRRG